MIDPNAALEQVIIFTVKVNETNAAEVERRIRETAEQGAATQIQVQRKQASTVMSLEDDAARQKRQYISDEERDYSEASRRRIDTLRKELAEQKRLMAESFSTAQQAAQRGEADPFMGMEQKLRGTEVRRTEQTLRDAQRDAQLEVSERVKFMQENPEAADPEFLKRQSFSKLKRSVGSGKGRELFDVTRRGLVGAAGAGAAGAIGGAGAKLGMDLIAGLAGITNPLATLGLVAQGIKDVVTAGYELALRNNAMQLARAGGTAGGAAQVAIGGGDIAQGMRESAIGLQRQLERNRDFTKEEQASVPKVLDVLAAAAPKLDQSDSGIEKVVTKLMDASRQTGIKPDDMARIAGDLARRQGFGTDAAGVTKGLEAVQEINAIATEIARRTGEIDSQKLVRRVMEAEEALRPLGYAFEDAGAVVLKWSRELERGTVTWGQITEMLGGARRQDTGTRAFLASRVAGRSEEEAQAGGFGEFRAALRTAGNDQYAQASLFRILQEGKGQNNEFLRANNIGGATREMSESAVTAISEMLARQARMASAREGEGAIREAAGTRGTQVAVAARVDEVRRGTYGAAMEPGVGGLAGVDQRTKAAAGAAGDVDQFGLAMTDAARIVKGLTGNFQEMADKARSWWLTVQDLTAAGYQATGEDSDVASRFRRETARNASRMVGGTAAPNDAISGAAGVQVSGTVQHEHRHVVQPDSEKHAELLDAVKQVSEQSAVDATTRATLAADKQMRENEQWHRTRAAMAGR